jgi:DNA helicase HerA-like ATPase
MIKEASARYDTVTVAIISGKDTKGTKQLRNQILEKCITEFGNIEIINASTGNIVTLVNKSTNNINTIIAGSDRVDSYKKAIKTLKGTGVYEVKRTDADISASKVISGLDNYEYFQKNTPKCSWPFYHQYLKVYK